MSDDLKSGGAGDLDPSGKEKTPPASKADDVVSRADHQRALDDMHKFKERTKVQATELATLKSTVEELSGKILSSSKDFETLFNQEKGKREAAESEKERLKGSVIYSERHKSAYPALKKAGLRDDADNLMDLMDLEAIEVEATSNGRFICSGVESFVESAKAKFPYAFQGKKAPTVNGGTGNGEPPVPTKLDPTKLFEIERQCRLKGDMKPYHTAVAEWNKQRRTAT